MSKENELTKEQKEEVTGGTGDAGTPCGFDPKARVCRHCSHEECPYWAEFHE